MDAIQLHGQQVEIFINCCCSLQVGGQATLSNGAYCPALDKPDQGLDLIRDSCKNAGLQLNENIGVIIDIGADKLFDQVCWKLV